ncbi:MAG: hypothetical protein K1X92_15270 [Bacteroidia bacterium]|nr:hypothetical protein [Bacteroidia bacterium]
MPSICLCFQVNQPAELNHYSFWDICKGKNAFVDEVETQAQIQKVSSNFYLPLNQKLRELMMEHKGNLRLSFYIPGATIDLFAQYQPKVLDSFAKLGWTNGAEFMGGTHNHSLSFFYSKSEFVRQVQKHHEKVRSSFDQEPFVFVHPELFYSDSLAATLTDHLQYSGIITDISSATFRNRNPNYLYNPTGLKRPALLIRNNVYSQLFLKLFQPSQKYSAREFVDTLREEVGRDQVVVIFLDYTLLFRRNAKTAIWLQVFTDLVQETLKHPDLYWLTPSMVVARHKPMDNLTPVTHSHDTSMSMSRSWFEHPFRKEALHKLYGMESIVKKSESAELMDIWSLLQSRDYLDRIVPGNEQPESSKLPYRDYNSFINMLSSLQIRLRGK